MKESRHKTRIARTWSATSKSHFVSCLADPVSPWQQRLGLTCHHDVRQSSGSRHDDVWDVAMVTSAYRGGG